MGTRPGTSDIVARAEVYSSTHIVYYTADSGGGSQRPLSYMPHNGACRDRRHHRGSRCSPYYQVLKGRAGAPLTRPLCTAERWSLVVLSPCMEAPSAELVPVSVRVHPAPPRTVQPCHVLSRRQSPRRYSHPRNHQRSALRFHPPRQSSASATRPIAASVLPYN